MKSVYMFMWEAYMLSGATFYLTKAGHMYMNENVRQ